MNPQKATWRGTVIPCFVRVDPARIQRPSPRSTTGSDGDRRPSLTPPCRSDRGGRGNLQLRCMAVGWLGTGTAGRTATARGDTEPLASVSSVSARKRKWMGLKTDQLLGESSSSLFLRSPTTISWDHRSKGNSLDGHLKIPSPDRFGLPKGF